MPLDPARPGAAPEPAPTRDELSLLAVLRAWGVDPGEAMRRVSAGEVTQDEDGHWHRRPGPRVVPAPGHLKLYRG